MVSISVQRGLMPHITQIAAQDMSTNAKFSCYVSPKVPINEKAEQTTGISWDGERMTVHGTQVATVSISEALLKIFQFFEKYRQCHFNCTQWKGF